MAIRWKNNRPITFVAVLVQVSCVVYVDYVVLIHRLKLLSFVTIESTTVVTQQIKKTAMYKMQLGRCASAVGWRYEGRRAASPAGM